MPVPPVANLLRDLPAAAPEEIVSVLAAGEGARIERIVSTGQATPEGQWYDQDRPEWVLLLSGAARLRFAEPEALVALRPGDHLTIPARCRHRVEWTDPDGPTVWLAVHYR